MSKLIYSAIASLDGYVADEAGVAPGPSLTRPCEGHARGKVVIVI